MSASPLRTDADATTSSSSSLSAAALDDRVRANLPLVGHLVREMLGRVPAHVNRDDLVSAGMYALTLAAKSFDPELGVPFGRFAAIRIRGALTDELRTMDWASRGVRSRARELDVVRGELSHELGRTPSRDELCRASGLSQVALSGVEADIARAATVSLHALTPEEGSEVLPTRDEGPEALLVRREQIGYLRDAVAELPERLRTVVEGYFFEGRKMTEIAEELGVTESRISQMRSEALTVLRAGLAAVDPDLRAPAPATRPRRAANTQAYAAAVASRSTLAGRLAATNVLGEALGRREPLADLPIAN